MHCPFDAKCADKPPLTKQPLFIRSSHRNIESLLFPFFFVSLFYIREMTLFPPLSLLAPPSSEVGGRLTPVPPPPPPPPGTENGREEEKEGGEKKGTTVAFTHDS